MSDNARSEAQNSTKPEYEANIDFTGFQTDIKPIALYLPQFHAFPENDAWWGKGFTEWDNVRKGEARFEGHDQPRVPHADIGFYDLSEADTLRKQARLAKEHGIYGFGIYYYWFSGKQLMKKPMELLMENKDIDMPFFLIWANENWTRAWDGNTRDVLIKQTYADDEPDMFIRDLKKYIDDDRYIRIDGKPVVGLYSPKEIPNIRRVLRRWRKAAFNAGIGDIYILTCASSATVADLQIADLVDGEYEFPPRLKGFVAQEFKPDEGVAYNYKELVEAERRIYPTISHIDFFRGTMLNWDNSARRKTGYNCWSNFSFELFYLWLKEEIVYSRRFLREDKRFVFVNAWNEWGEGTYLEPDAKYGYTAINTLSRAIYGLPFGDEAEKTEPKVHIIGTGVSTDKSASWAARIFEEPHVAVQAHVFYDDLIGEVVKYTNHISVPFDLYISTNSEEKANRILGYLYTHSDACHICVEVYGNVGRDVIPFLKQMESRIQRYDYLCHMHTKKSNHASILGDVWRDYLYENLMGSRDLVSEILTRFETDEKVGIIMPENLDMLKDFVMWGSNRELAQTLMKRIGCDIKLHDEPIMFPAGDMFWMRTKAVQNMFNTAAFSDMIPEESGQIDGTVMHAIERSWLYLAENNGYTYAITRSIIDNRPLISHQDLGVIRYQPEPASAAAGPAPTEQNAVDSVDLMLKGIASAIGVIQSLKVIAWSIWIWIGKTIHCLQSKRLNEGEPYAPRKVARMIGINNSFALFKMAIGYYLLK